LTNRREAILNGTAPIWENHISHFPESVPPSFPAEFRRLRNVASGHVSTKRSKLSLTEFYDKHHKYVHMLYLAAKSWWGRTHEEFPDLDEITAFSVLLKEQSPSAADHLVGTGFGWALSKQ
jgi:hypothetical protein